MSHWIVSHGYSSDVKTKDFTVDIGIYGRRSTVDTPQLLPWDAVKNTDSTLIWGAEQPQNDGDVDVPPRVA